MPTTLTRIAFVAELLLSPMRAYADGLPTADLSPAKRSVSTARTAEPQSVRSAMSALFNACADWPRELPVSPEADIALLERGTPIDAVLCDAVVDPDGRSFPIIVVSLLITAAVLGTFAGAFMASAALLRWMCGSLRRAVFAARGVQSSLGDR